MPEMRLTHSSAITQSAVLLGGIARSEDERQGPANRVNYHMYLAVVAAFRKARRLKLWPPLDRHRSQHRRLVRDCRGRLRRYRGSSTGRGPPLIIRELCYAT